jgi:uncharacterized phage-associated protein
MRLRAVRVKPGIELGSGMHDARAIANLILDEGQRMGHPVSNVALQKLLYFAHGLYLVEQKRPLVSGFFEAWRYGPVHPVVFHCFKSAGDQPIAFRATAIDALTGQPRPLPVPSDSEGLSVVERVVTSYGRLTAGRLIDVSHAKSAPWDFVVENSKGSVSLGLRITNDVILERFKFHKVSVAEVPHVGEPGDDTPLLA